jgi:hypothetical protein
MNTSLKIEKLASSIREWVIFNDWNEYYYNQDKFLDQVVKLASSEKYHSEFVQPLDAVNMAYDILLDDFIKFLTKDLDKGFAQKRHDTADRVDAFWERLNPKK